MVKKGVIIWFFLAAVSLVSAQPDAEVTANSATPSLDVLHRFLATDLSGTSKYTKEDSEYTALLHKLISKRPKFRSEKDFASFIFYHVHKKALAWYQSGYPSFGELFTTGHYDCLSATALYALLLRDLGMEFEVVEYEYHIFLMVNTRDGQVLFEATDPLNGFERKPEEIAKRLEQYERPLSIQLAGLRNQTPATGRMVNTIGLVELEGLLYYNQAVRLFNAGKPMDAIPYLLKAAESYPCDRVDTLLELSRSSH
jgi:hypothetical protein